MSRPRSKRQSVPRSRKPQHDPYTSRIKREPSKRELEDTLRHAVRNQDLDALEDYDEKDPHPVGVTGAVTDKPYVEDFDWREELHGGYDDDSAMDWYHDED